MVSINKMITFRLKRNKMKKINYFTPAAAMFTPAAMLSQHNAAERFSAALPKAIKGVRFAGTDRGPLDSAVIHDCPRLLCLLSGAAG